jgi:hypothetical protein
LRCDDSCGTPPPWREDPDAWQWSALGRVSLVGLGLAVLVLIGIAGRRTKLAWLAAATWAVTGVVFLVLLDESGLT